MVLTGVFRLKITFTDFYLSLEQVLLLLRCYVKTYYKYWSSFGKKKERMLVNMSKSTFTQKFWTLGHKWTVVFESIICLPKL